MMLQSLFRRLQGHITSSHSLILRYPTFGVAKSIDRQASSTRISHSRLDLALVRDISKTLCFRWR